MEAVHTLTDENFTTRRTSKHLFDPTLYSIPKTQKRDLKKSASYNHYKYNSNNSTVVANIITIKDTFIQNATDLQTFILQQIPEDCREKYLPKIDYKICGACFFWYFCSSISSNISKLILIEATNPIALTEIQFLISCILCFNFIALINYYAKPTASASIMKQVINNFPEGILPTYLDGNFNNSIRNEFLKPTKLIFTTTFPLGIFQFCGHTLTHNATSLIPISLVHSIKALSPIITVLYYKIVMGRKYNNLTYYTLTILVSGVVITCWPNSTKPKKGSSNAENESFGTQFMGLLFAFMSVLVFVSQNLFAKNIFTVKNQDVLPNKKTVKVDMKGANFASKHIDKITILFYSSTIGFVITLPILLFNEILYNQSILQGLNWKVMELILLHGLAHFFQTISAFQLIGMLNSITYSVANIMKRIVIISIALLWENNFTPSQILGLLLTIAGLYGYDKWGRTI